MIFLWWHKFLALVLVAIAPIVTLLIRGVVWGSDSFGYWGYSCGTYVSGQYLHPPMFLWFIKNVVACNLYQLAFIMFVFYFFALCAFWIIGKHFFMREGWRLSIYIAALTPLFFIEALRFEPEFFGWTLAFISLGLFVWIIDKQKVYNKY